MNKKVRAISKATLKQNREIKKVMNAVAEEVKHCEDWYPVEYKTALGFAQDLVKAIRKRRPKYTREELPDEDIDGAELAEFVNSDVCEAVSVLLDKKKNRQDKGVTTSDVCKQLSLSEDDGETVYCQLCRGLACQELCIVGFDVDAPMFGARFHHA